MSADFSASRNSSKLAWTSSLLIMAIGRSLSQEPQREQFDFHFLPHVKHSSNTAGMEPFALAGFPRRQVHFGRSGCGGFDSKSVDTLSSFQDLASSRRARSFFSAPLYASLPSNSRNGGFCSCVSRTIA